MSKITIKTNNIPRHVVYGFELSERERAEFDYLSGESLDTNSFFRYKGVVYDLGQFLALNRDRNNCFAPEEFSGWHGYMSDSYFSGILVRYSDCGDAVVCATYFS